MTRAAEFCATCSPHSAVRDCPTSKEFAYSLVRSGYDQAQSAGVPPWCMCPRQERGKFYPLTVGDGTHYASHCWSVTVYSLYRVYDHPLMTQWWRCSQSVSSNSEGWLDLFVYRLKMPGRNDHELAFVLVQFQFIEHYPDANILRVHLQPICDASK